MSEQSERLVWARQNAKYATAADAARAMGVEEPTYFGHENGQRGLSRAGRRYADFFKVSYDWLMHGRGEPLERKSEISERFPIAAGRRRMPVLGKAVGGGSDDGRFIFNGERITEVLAPAALEHVADAYGVYMQGTSMEPRYYAGEMLHIHPHKAIRQGDFVVVQFHDGEDDGQAPLGFVKQFWSRSAKETVLRQLNPPEGEDETIRLPSARVISVHKIVGTGEG
jgi:phage repressor protein C with HTH and peptisase S24 domain